VGDEEIAIFGGGMRDWCSLCLGVKTAFFCLEGLGKSTERGYKNCLRRVKLSK